MFVLFSYFNEFSKGWKPREASEVTFHG